MESEAALGRCPAPEGMASREERGPTMGPTKVVWPDGVAKTSLLAIREARAPVAMLLQWIATVTGIRPAELVSFRG